MDKNKLEQFKALFERYQDGTCTEEERALVEHWYNQAGDSRADGGAKGLSIPAGEIQADIDFIRGKLPGMSAYPLESGKNQPSAEHAQNRGDEAGPLVSSDGKQSPWKGYGASRFTRLGKYAAAILILMLLGGLYWYTRSGNSGPETPAMVGSSGDILPGGNKATLTLADGSKVELDGQQVGTIARQAEHVVYKSKDGQIIYKDASGDGATSAGLKTPALNTITTPRGGQYHVTLPDGGTEVWLNAASSLTYSTSFTADERIVHLQGEGYFEVAPDPGRPFKVITETQEVEVLGTHFNVKSYKDEPAVLTTLLEGSVRIENKATKQSVKLVPGEQARMQGENFRILKVAAGDAIAWKDGLFRFNNSDIPSVMRQLSRWYDVQVEFQGKIPDIKLWGEVYRNVGARQALEILQYFNLKYRIESNKGVKKIIISDEPIPGNNPV